MAEPFVDDIGFQRALKILARQPDRHYYSGGDQVKRVFIANRDGWRCGICGDPIDDLDDLHIDHIVARSRGGVDDFTNCRAAHRTCNLSRGALDLVP